MARRKSVCVKWTVALVLVLCSSSVLSRPQEIGSVAPSPLEQTTENSIRYKDNDSNNTKLPLLINLESNNTVNFNSSYISNGISNLFNNNSYEVYNVLNGRNQRDTRKISNSRPTNKQTNKIPNTNNDSLKHDKPIIKKVITKWTDKTKFEDLDFSPETFESEEKDLNKFNFNNDYSDESYSTENTYKPIVPNLNRPYSSNNIGTPIKYQRPHTTYTEESHAYSSNMHNNHPYTYTRPTYIFTTPSPTPIITNVGYPSPWQQSNLQNIQKPPQHKPAKPNRPANTHNYNSVYHHTSYPSNRPGTFEATTFQPSPVYTDQIVIRPDEYSASDNCPTIYMTLNNTFQGEAKEACPDLNIAVNTNVINKNVAVESEEITGSTLTDIFGLPNEESGSEEDANSNEFNGSDETDEESESASVEGLSLLNYNSDSDVSAGSDSGDSFASPSNALSEVKKPNRPNKKKNELSAFDSILDYMQPLISGFSWLAAINPFSFSALSFLLTPIILIVAAISGVVALFSPFSYARGAPETAPIEYPSWQLDDYYKSWYFNSLADTRRWQPELPRSILENNNTNMSFKVSLLNRIKTWLQALTIRINDKKRIASKNKRKKRETWMIRVK